MFCAGCGSQLQSGLNYCSRCGRRVVEDVQSANAFWTNPLAMTGATAAIGFIAFIIIIRILTRSDVPPNFFAPLAFVYFGSLFGICFMMLRHGTALAKQNMAPVSTIAEDGVPQAYLSPVTTAQLREGFDEPASVTDHTTRALNEVPRRKN